MRAGRLLSVLMLLQTRGRMSAEELAAELDVSVRTVYRDVEALGEAGIPVCAERGPGGGYRLRNGYRTRLTGLTTDEAGSLFLSGLPGPAAELGFGSVLAAAQLKLLAALPSDLRLRAERIRERFHLDAPGWFREADQPPHLTALADAVWSQQTVRVRYRRWAAPREVVRTLEPLGVVLKGGTWYVVARAAGQARTYRVSHVLELTTQDTHFERPAGFDLAGFWRSWSERFEADVYRGEAVVRLSPRGLERLPMLLGQAVADAASDSAGPPDADGWARVVIPIESIEHAVVELLKLGADAEAVAPIELRRRLAAIVRGLAEIYGTDSEHSAAYAPNGVHGGSLNG